MDILCNKQDVFKNPQKLPLNALYLDFTKVIRTSKEEASLEEMMGSVEHGRSKGNPQWHERYQVKTEKRPALDKCWLPSEKRYVKFLPFYLQFDDKENHQFLEENAEFLETIRHLTDCSYHQFWCYIVHEPRVSFVIRDFLEHAVPLHAVSYLSSEFLQLYNQIYFTISAIYERLLAIKVSEVEHMPKNIVLDFLEKNELLNVHSIYLCCSLYNQTQPRFVAKLFDFYFHNKCMERHGKELSEMLIDITQEFYKLDALDLLSNIRSSGVTLRRKPSKFDPIWLEETSCYMLEMAASLCEFLSVYKPAIDIIFELELPQRLPHIYQKVYMELYELFETSTEIGYDWSRYRLLITEWLAKGRAEFINLFNIFSNHLLDKVITMRDDRSQQDVCLETYLELISAASYENLFIKDFNKAYPVEAQFQLLIDNIPDFDRTQTDYLVEILQGAIKEPVETDGEPKAIENDSNEDVFESIYDTLTQYKDITNSNEATPGTSAIPEPVLIALRQYIQLVHRYNFEWNPPPQQLQMFDPAADPNRPSEDEIEQRIKAVHEMLPHLQTTFVLRCLERMDYRPERVVASVLDGDLPLDLVEIPPDLSPLPGGSGSPRKKPVPKVAEHIGKKPDYADAKDLLDNKEEDIKQLVLNASRAYDLDDDYDDRNDIYTTFEPNDESKIYRHLRQSDVIEYSVVSDASSSSEEEESGQSKPKDAFCEDPAVVRARREAQRGRVSRPPRNVVGKPKGQGQDANVQHNRDKKNVHKSSRANHNRKGGAQWKRSRAMVPS